MTALLPAVARLLQRPEVERRLGPFVLVQPLGSGGFAPVWLAREVYGATELRTAAVKLFSLEDAEEPASGAARSSARERIVAEARALCRVEHPNVVRFYALPIDEAGGVVGLAMEHVAGTPLDARIAAAGKLPVADALRVGIAIASALSAVHRAGLVHRDVKPANVVEAAGVYKLIDFGIAAADAWTAAEPQPSRRVPERRRPEALRPQAQRSGTLKVASPPLRDEPEDRVSTARAVAQSGTVGYMDPVCFAAGVLPTPASDIYALGATLFECLTGRVPAAATAPGGAQLDLRVLTGAARPRAVVELAPDAPAALAAVVERMLAPDREERPPSAEWVALRLEQIRRELAGIERALPPEDVGPFRGLGRFEERDRDVYFGRASEIAAALEVARSRGLLALVGSSGSGKSSLARAGVLPAIAEGALGGWPARWDTAVAEPGGDPRAAVAAALAPFVPGAAGKTPDAVVAALADRAQSSGRGVVLLVDQLEELATLADEESRDWTAALLCRFGDQALPGVRAVVAARRDLLDRLLALGDLGRALARGLVLLEPISELGWSDVLDQALAAYGYTFEDDALRQELLDDLVATAGAMPLAQFALAELWRKRDGEQKKITRAGLRAIGGIAGALEQHAEATLDGLEQDEPGAVEAARVVLLALTTPEGTRAARTKEELVAAAGAAGGAVIDAFVRARLVVPAEGAGGERGGRRDGAGAARVTLAHEALLAQWGRLRAWVAEAREHRVLAGEIERDAARWRADPEAVPLWQRRRLAYAEELRKRGVLQLSADGLAFLRAGRRAVRRVRLAIAGAVGMVVVSVALAGAAYVRAAQANVRAAEAVVRAAQTEEAATRERLLKEQEALRALKEKNEALAKAEADKSDLLDDVRALTHQLNEANGANEINAIRKRLNESMKVSGPAGPARAAASAPAGAEPDAPAPAGSADPFKPITTF